MRDRQKRKGRLLAWAFALRIGCVTALPLALPMALPLALPMAFALVKIAGVKPLSANNVSAGSIAAGAFDGGALDRQQRHRAHVMGPFDTVTVLLGYAESERAFNRQAQIVFARLEALHQMYDIFSAYAGLNNLRTINDNAGIAPVEVAQEIIDMLLAARLAYEITGGRTNAAMGSVLSIWRERRASGLANPESAALPSMSELREAAQRMSMSDVIIDNETRAVFLRRRGMSLDVGSIAKGFAAELALAAGKEAGLQSALLSVGGHVVALGAPPGREHWNVAIQNPDSAPGAPGAINARSAIGGRGAPGARGATAVSGAADTIALTGAAVSISGAHQRFYVVNGQSFGHIIDPATLMPADLHRQVAVVHPQSWMADALSTALFILPLEEGKALAASAGAEAFWIDRDGNWFATPGYARISSAF